MKWAIYSQNQKSCRDLEPLPRGRGTGIMPDSRSRQQAELSAMHPNLLALHAALRPEVVAAASALCHASQSFGAISVSRFQDATISRTLYHAP
ncbi:hypothetical protein ACOSQ4_007119 [Xanthoceras sorbifolium]